MKFQNDTPFSDHVTEVSQGTVNSYLRKSLDDPKRQPGGSKEQQHRKGWSRAFDQKRWASSTVKEEVEMVTELSKATLGRYAKAAPASAQDHQDRAKELSNIGHDFRREKDRTSADKFFDKAGGHAIKAANRRVGHGKVIDRLTREDAERVDEIPTGFADNT
jgi:hypothetical protein